MWIVRIALRRPYTFVVLAMLIVIVGGLTLKSMSTDMLPEIDIPVIAVINTYTGLSPDEVTARITTPLERASTTTVNGIEHIESQSLNGVSVTKIFLQPGTNVEGAIAEVTAEAQSILKSMPPGATAPLILRYSASNVPILQAVLTSDVLSEQQLFDLGSNFFRTGLATVQGAQLPLPLGGKVREVVVDLDVQKLSALGLSPSDVSNAVNAENLVLPSGTVKMGRQEYPLVVNASPGIVDELNDLPIKTVNGATVFIRDVAHVRDGFAPQTSVVLADGRKAALLPILKSQGSSTVSVVDLPAEGEMRAVARLEDLGVPAQPFDLRVERLHLAARRHAVAEEVAEVADELAGLARLLGHQPGDGVQRVDEEVRLQAGAELGELGLAAKLVGLEGADARVLDGEGEDERQRPDGEAGEAERESDAQHVGGAPRSVERPQRRDGEARRARRPEEAGEEEPGGDRAHEERADDAELPPRGPAEDGECPDDEHRQPDRERDRLGEKAPRVSGAEEFRPELEERDADHHEDAEKTPPPRSRRLDRSGHGADCSLDSAAASLAAARSLDSDGSGAIFTIQVDGAWLVEAHPRASRRDSLRRRRSRSTWVWSISVALTFSSRKASIPIAPI